VSDIEHSILLEVIDSHKQEDIIEALLGLPLEIREQVEEVSVDMWGGFPKVIEQVFPNASVVIDRFHVMKYVNEDLDKIIRQSKKRFKHLKMKNAKYLLLRNKSDLDEEQVVQVEQLLSCSQRLRESYRLKESFRDIFERRQTCEEGRIQIEEWIKKGERLYCDSIKTIKNHLDGICNYFINRTTSGVMEGINNKIKLIKRQAYGFTNFENLRIRLLANFS
jgi:transposase